MDWRYIVLSRYLGIPAKAVEDIVIWIDEFNEVVVNRILPTNLDLVKMEFLDAYGRMGKGSIGHVLVCLTDIEREQRIKEV